MSDYSESGTPFELSISGSETFAGMDTGAVKTSASQFTGQPVDQKARLKKASEGFEAQWFQQVMSEAHSSGSKTDSFATQTFRGMMNETLAQSMSKTHTLGLADMLVRQLQSHVSKDSHDATSPAHGTDAAPTTDATQAAAETAQPETQP